MDAKLADVAAVFAAAAVAAIFLVVERARRRQALARRIRGPVEAKPRATRDAREAVRARAARPELAAGISRRLTRTSLGAWVQGRLVRAGLALKPGEFILLQAAAAAAAALVALFAMRGDAAAVRLAAAAALGGAGFAAPLLVLGLKERWRLSAFERQLPEAIDTMAGTLQAGSGLPQALDLIGREMVPPISVEFRRVLREMELGLSLPDALSNLLNRVGSADLVLLTSAVAIQSRVGGDLAEVFRGIAHTIRERLRIRSEINVLTAQGRYSTYIIIALPICMFAFIWITNYDYLSQLFLPGMRYVLWAGIAGMVVGYVAMRRIISIEV